MFSDTPNRSQPHLVSHSSPYVILKKKKKKFLLSRKTLKHEGLVK